MTIDDLPAVNAALNGIATIAILTGFYFIKKKNEGAHRKAMMTALAASTVFLACYLTHKFYATHKVFPSTYGNFVRTSYLIMLFTHVVLAASVVPLVLLSVVAALKDNRARHKKLVRWTLPIWLYVSVTGVLIYFCVYVWFPG